MAVAVGVPAEIVNLIQDRTLERLFEESLFPNLLFRAAARPELWPANVGDRQMFTRSGLMPVKTTPLVPGSDPVPSTYPTEQWEVEAAQYGDAIDTHMPTSYVSIASLYLQNTQALGMNAGQTLNRLVRNKLYRAYTAGNTNAIAAASAGATQIRVASLSGFTEQLLQGRPQPVGPANGISVSFSGAEVDNTVIGAIPDSPSNPFGPGTLYLSTALATGIALRDGVQSETRTRVVRVGGGGDVDALTASNILTLQDLINAAAMLKSWNVPKFPDGTYHVHINSIAEAQLFADAAFRNLNQGQGIAAGPYASASIGRIAGMTFFVNNEVPDPENVSTLVDTSGGSGDARAGFDISADVINDDGVPVQRTIIMGAGAIMEKFLDESKYITEAGVTGKIGSFNITNNGLQIMTERIRYIARSPLDRLQQIYSQAWSWSGDFALPTDQGTGTPARYKRAIILEHA